MFFFFIFSAFKLLKKEMANFASPQPIQLRSIFHDKIRVYVNPNSIGVKYSLTVWGGGRKHHEPVYPFKFSTRALTNP